MTPRLLAFVPLLAQNTGIDFAVLIQHLLAALIFSLLGVVIFVISFLLIIKFCPFSIRKEIEEDQNIALGVIIGSAIIGLSIIIAAAIHG